MGRVLAIGDIHGCAGALDALLEAVRPGPDDLVITLGDYVDRGQDSKGVLDRLIALSGQTRLVPILGNHDQMMLDARSDPEKQHWLEARDWGRKTLASYGPDATLADVPGAHWAFLERCVESYELDTHFFVHANAYPDTPLAEQPSFMLRWEKLHHARPHESGKTMVCGHTSQKSGKPRNLGHAVCIDTWVYGRGSLTALEVRTGAIWQATEDGLVTGAVLDDFGDEDASW
jgi:serine/threonine protein phosphatase 1